LLYWRHELEHGHGLLPTKLDVDAVARFSSRLQRDEKCGEYVLAENKLKQYCGGSTSVSHDVSGLRSDLASFQHVDSSRSPEIDTSMYLQIIPSVSTMRLSLRAYRYRALCDDRRTRQWMRSTCHVSYIQQYTQHCWFPQQSTRPSSSITLWRKNSQCFPDNGVPRGCEPPRLHFLDKATGLRCGHSRRKGRWLVKSLSQHCGCWDEVEEAQ
jgi:hypothetical protein